MDGIPIKLISNENVRNHLLQLKGETLDIDTDDYIECRMNTNNAAKYLMAIEDASEIAKNFLHEYDIFEKIGGDIKNDATHEFKFTCHRTSRMTKPSKPKHTGVHYIHISHTYPNGDGHYALAKVNHMNKTITVFDSMGPRRREFRHELKTVYGKEYTIHNKPNAFQPTGGFVTPDIHTYKELLKDTKIRIRDDRVLEKSFEISQYDELSQHHFCYIEAFIAMMHDTLGTCIGPKDPRDRLAFIKRIVWGLIHKYVSLSHRKTINWEYFVTNFPYYIRVTNSCGDKFKLNHIAQIPKINTERTRKSLIKLELPGTIDSSWSLTQIVNWAGSKI